MKRESFNRGWTFYNVRDEKKKTVNLPHDAMLYEKRLAGLKDGYNTGFFPGGKYVYEKKLFGEEEYKDKTLILEFEGVYMKSEVFLNGEKLGGRIYGYSAFYVDLTGKLKTGKDNEIKVVVDNTQTPNARWYTGSGIYRDVNLYIGSREYIKPDGVKIFTKSINPAVLEVSIDIETQKPLQTVTQIIQDGRVVAESKGEKCEITVDDAMLWSERTPNLYDVRVTLMDDGKTVDEVQTRTGIRKIEWNANNGLMVNGNSIKLRGGCIHHEHGPLGAASFKKAELRRIKILKKAGFNAVRYSHNPANKAFLDACDELGMYVMNETFDVWRSKKSDYDYGLYFDKEWEKDVTSMVEKSYNHPSVIMYSIGNEIPETAVPEGIEISRKLNSLIKSLDPTLPTINCFNLLLIGMAQGTAFNKSETGPDDIVDPYLEEADSKRTGSALVNMLITLMPLLMKILGSAKRTQKKAKQIFETVDIVGYNYGAHAYEKHHLWNPDRVMLGSETYPSKISGNWRLVEEIPALIGDFMWTAWDYLGESGAGVPVYGKNKSGFYKPYPCISSGTGSVDITGLIGAQGYYSKVVWNEHKQPYICVRPVNRTGEKYFLGQWRGTDAVSSWSWTGQEGRKAEVEVFSIGDAVELIQDGKSLGTKQLEDHKAMFETIYQPGELCAVSYDTQGEEIARSELKSASEETVMTVLPEDKKIKADGQDLAYIALHITDTSGTVKLLDDRKIEVEVKGPAELAGIGSADPFTQESFIGQSFATYNGRIIAIVKSGLSKGSVIVRFSSEELKTVETQIEVI